MSKQIYKTGVFGGFMPSPNSDSDSDHYAKKASRVKNSCLDNKNYKVDPSSQNDFIHEKFYDYTTKKEKNFFGTISDGIRHNGNINEDVFIKTMMSFDKNTLADMTYNIEAYAKIPNHIAKIEKMNEPDCKLIKESDQPTDGELFVLIMEKMQSFKQEVIKLYKLDDPESHLDKFKNFINKATDTCDHLNIICEIYHTNLTYKNIGIRTTGKESYDVILTNFSEATDIKKGLKLPKNSEERIIPINSFYLCVYIYKNMDWKNHQEWLIYLLHKGSFYYNFLEFYVKQEMFLSTNIPPNISQTDIDVFSKSANMFFNKNSIDSFENRWNTKIKDEKPPKKLTVSKKKEETPPQIPASKTKDGNPPKELTVDQIKKQHELNKKNTSPGNYPLGKKRIIIHGKKK